MDLSPEERASERLTRVGEADESHEPRSGESSDTLIGMPRGRFLLLFALSGAAALIYEVVWTRLLTLYMGHGLAAASTVVAAFMGGLAVGSSVGGRVASRMAPRVALAFYAGLEVAIALLALMVAPALSMAQPLLSAAYADGNGGLTFAVLRLALSLTLLAAPAAAMGATLPVASQWLVRHASRTTSDVGALYTANTLGAAAGALVAGFSLIPQLGLAASTWVGAALNVAAGGGAFLILRRSADESLEAPPATAGPRPTERRNSRRRSRADQGVAERRPAIPAWIAPATLGVTGCASLTLQMVWTRLFAMIVGPTTYAFSVIVAVFILGIAGGAALGTALASKTRHPAGGLGLWVLASAAASLAAGASVDWALRTFATIVARPDVTFDEVIVREALLVAALLLPMAITFGAAFPFAVALIAQEDGPLAKNLGRLYAVNTVGAIAGSLLAGFVLVPRFGLRSTIGVLAAAVAAWSATVLLAGRTRGAARAIGVVGAVAIVAATMVWPEWDRLLLSSGAYKYAVAAGGPDLETALTAGELVSYREGAAGTVAVRRLAGTVSLAIDGKVDASNGGDMLTQRLLAHLPLLLHAQPARAAILGLGSGVTLGSALTHPLTDALVLEISPEVVDASHAFDRENHRALADSRTRLVVGDGRTHLLLGREQYDVIVSEPSNPWMAGVASLFTREFFEAARGRLAPGGLLCQWAHTYDISRADLQSIVATFLSVFPDGTMWLVGDADVLLIGSTEPLGTRIAGLESAWQRAGVAEDLASVGVRSPFALLSMFVAGGPALGAWATGATLQTDDHMRLEFTGPRSIFGVARDDNAASLRDLQAHSPQPSAVSGGRSRATAADWRDRGAMLLRADAHRPAYDDFARALADDPGDAVALDGLIRSAGPINRTSDARSLITRLASAPDRVPAQLALSRLLASQGAADEAAGICLSLLQANPGHIPALEQLASVLSDVGDAERLAPVAARLMAEAPSSPAAHYYAAALMFLRDRPEETLGHARAAVAIDPGHARALNLIGASLASMGQRDQARAAFDASLAADPREAGTYTNLATLEMQSGNRQRAIQYFAEALTVDPNSETARQGLASATSRR